MFPREYPESPAAVTCALNTAASDNPPIRPREWIALGDSSRRVFLGGGASALVARERFEGVQIFHEWVRPMSTTKAPTLGGRKLAAQEAVVDLCAILRTTPKFGAARIGRAADTASGCCPSRSDGHFPSQTLRRVTCAQVALGDWNPPISVPGRPFRHAITSTRGFRGRILQLFVALHIQTVVCSSVSSAQIFSFWPVRNDGPVTWGCGFCAIPLLFFATPVVPGCLR